MFDLIVLLFFERGLICTDEANARVVAQAIIKNEEWENESCGPVTGDVTVGKGLPMAYFLPSGFGVRVTEGTYLGKKVYFFRMEYRI